jgi:[ribosomal protein S18]-alanine N-acetyltransferase
MSGRPTFRPYEERDLEAMFLLDIVCFERPFRFRLEDIRAFAAEPDAVTVVAEDEGKLLGFFIVERSGRSESGGSSAYVVTLDVSPEHRRRGLGRELLLRAEGAFADVERMVLHVHVGNEAAIRFYEANGYERTGEAKSFYGRGIDAWIYTKELERGGA